METQTQLQIQTYQMKPNIRFLQYCVLRHHFLQVFSLILTTSLFSLTSEVNADIISVTPTPASISIGMSNKGLTTAKVKWQVIYLDTFDGPGSLPNPRLVSSPSAILKIGNSTVATLAGAISRITNGDSKNSETFFFNETYTLNANVARRVASSAPGSVRIVRTFTDPQKLSKPGAITLFSKAKSEGVLSIRRINLAFENNGRTDVIYKGDTIRAVADLSFRNSGTLRAEWRIVDPSASLGGSSGRILNVIRQNMVSSGEGRTRIVSPPLPTNKNGLYMLAFAIHENNSNLETPILRYFVLDNKGSSLTTQPTEIGVFSPAKGANLNRNTVFSWEGIENAQAYQVEIFRQGDIQPLTGKLVPAKNLKLSLTGLSFDWLQAAEKYTWRVRAFDMTGLVIGQSAFKPVYTSP